VGNAGKWCEKAGKSNLFCRRLPAFSHLSALAWESREATSEIRPITGSSRRDGESSRPADGIVAALRISGLLDSIF